MGFVRRNLTFDRFGLAAIARAANAAVQFEAAIMAALLPSGLKRRFPVTLKLPRPADADVVTDERW